MGTWEKKVLRKAAARWEEEKESANSLTGLCVIPRADCVPDLVFSCPWGGA